MIAASAQTGPAVGPAPPPKPSPLRVAVVGCGAIARDFHVPVLAGHDGLRLVALVDRDAATAASLAGAYGVPISLADSRLLDPEQVDAALIATPPGAHAPCAIDLLRRGIHVLVEKPLATTAAEAEAMIEAAERSGAVLAAGYFRRLYPGSRLFRAALEIELLGRPLRFDVEEGHLLDWPSVTLGGMRRVSAGGGVLIDTGSHTLDQLLSFFPGPAELLAYHDNSLGGIEAECALRLCLRHRGRPVEGRVTLSRTRKLRNTFRVECERGALELPVGERNCVSVTARDERLVDAAANEVRAHRTRLGWDGPARDDFLAPFRAEIDDWLGAIRAGRPPYLSGQSALPVVRLIEECYRRPLPLEESWTREGLGEAPLPAQPRRSPGRVLVTGATGLIGCRAAEVLRLRDNWEVRALVHNPGSASRLARLPVEMVLGDLRSPDDLARAVAGCDAVVHCAYGKAWGQRQEIFKATVGGTRDLARAARAAGVGRFVHLSTIAVHGHRVEGRIDEDTPLRPGDGDYAQSKAEAEWEVIAAARAGLPAVVLRLANVYGPFSSPYTIRPVEYLAAGVPVLLGDGDTPSNTVYVDNVVAAIVQALAAPPDSVAGEVFTIGDGDDVSWAEFHRYYADGLGLAVRAVSVEEFERMRAPAPRHGLVGWLRSWFRGLSDVLTSPELIGLGKKVLRTDPLGAWPRRALERFPGLRERLRRRLKLDRPSVYLPAAADPRPLPPVELLELFSCPAPVRIDKARRQLGYAPAVPRDRAMALTLDWVRHARLVPQGVNEPCRA